jgi:16S rRNA processing protein RimM
MNRSDDRGEGRIALAAVAGAHGVKGELRLKLFSDSLDSLSQQRTVLLAGLETTLLSVRMNGKAAVARLEGVNDRSTAEALRGKLIEVDRNALPPLEAGEYYYTDLIGVAAEDSLGQPIGTVKAIHNFGAGDLLEIATGDAKTSLIPFRAGIADLVDGRVICDREFLA